jgi:hypothetical protein
MICSRFSYAISFIVLLKHLTCLLKKLRSEGYVNGSAVKMVMAKIGREERKHILYISPFPIPGCHAVRGKRVPEIHKTHVRMRFFPIRPMYTRCVTNKPICILEATQLETVAPLVYKQRLFPVIRDTLAPSPDYQSRKHGCNL